MRLFLLDNKVRSLISELIAYAEANPVTVNEDTINDVQRHSPIGNNPKHVIHIPNGFRVVFSIENQPAGMCRHLSVSIDKDHDLPNLTVVEELIKLFEFKRELHDCHLGMEKVSPTRNVISIVELIDK